MNIWNCDNWKKVYKGNNIRNGLRLRFDVNVDEEVKLALKDFAKHLRKEYSFPYRVNVYVKSKMKIKAIDGELVDGTFWGPYDKLEEPFIRISVGDYCKEKIKNKEKPFIKICIYTSLYVIGKENYLYNLLEMINEKNYINRISVINSLDYIASENNKDEILRVLKERRSNENKRIVINLIEELINDLKNDLFWDREL